MRYLALLIFASCSSAVAPPAAAGSIAKPPVTPSTPAVKPGPAATSPTAVPEREVEPENGALAGMTARHNEVRAAVGVAALAWSKELAAHAQRWADQIAKNDCQLAHRSNDAYGENLYWASGGAKTPAQVVGLWATEKESYDHASNRCARGQVCGHYTQIVWSSTQRIGCGKATCGGGEVWVCNYDPPGNFTGQSPY